MGFAIPFAFIPISIAALAGVSHDEAGLASGLINTAQQIGGAVGIAIASSVSVTRFNHLIALHGRSYFPQAFTSGTSLAFWVLVGISVAAFLAGLLLIRREELATVEPQSSPGAA
jgi:MFS family permease